MPAFYALYLMVYASKIMAIRRTRGNVRLMDSNQAAQTWSSARFRSEMCLAGGRPRGPPVCLHCKMEFDSRYGLRYICKANSLQDCGGWFALSQAYFEFISSHTPFVHTSWQGAIAGALEHQWAPQQEAGWLRCCAAQHKAGRRRSGAPQGQPKPGEGTENSFMQGLQGAVRCVSQRLAIPSQALVFYFTG
jgi:hypothetical protein